MRYLPVSLGWLGALTVIQCLVAYQCLDRISDVRAKLFRRDIPFHTHWGEPYATKNGDDQQRS